MRCKQEAKIHSQLSNAAYKVTASRSRHALEQDIKMDNTPGVQLPLMALGCRCQQSDKDNGGTLRACFQLLLTAE